MFGERRERERAESGIMATFASKKEDEELAKICHHKDKRLDENCIS